MAVLPRSSTLFPYTTLFRSESVDGSQIVSRGNATPQHAGDSGRGGRGAGGTGGNDERGVSGSLGKQGGPGAHKRSEEHTSELQSLRHLVCRLLLEKKNKKRH